MERNKYPHQRVEEQKAKEEGGTDYPHRHCGKIGNKKRLERAKFEEEWGAKETPEEWGNSYYFGED